MDNSIYEVDRQEYVGFISEIKPDCKVIEKYEDEDGLMIVKTIGQESKTHFCSEVIDKESGDKHYYIFNMPAPEERQSGRPTYRLNLESREEVQAFMNILSRIQKGEKL